MLLIGSRVKCLGANMRLPALAAAPVGELAASLMRLREEVRLCLGSRA